MKKDNILSDNKKNKKSKDIMENYDNSVSISFKIDKLSDKEVNKINKVFDDVQKEFKNNISQYYIKTSTNKTKKKGFKDICDDFGALFD